MQRNTEYNILIDTVDVQRLSDSVGVKPQANGGRKILTLITKGLQIVYTLGNASGNHMITLSKLRLIENTIIYNS